jgi:hypothetical protein
MFYFLFTTTHTLIYYMKHELDQFYTITTLAKKLIELIDLSFYELIIEPSAGNGSFSNNLPSDKLLALDIDPKNSNIKKQDFFTFDEYVGDRSKILCIGNPPFGKQGSLALRFIKHCTKFANTIAFILPRSFLKDSVQEKIPCNYHLIKSIILDENCFELNGKPYDVPCVFQIWQWKEELRQKKEKISANGFRYSDKDNADFSVRRVGFYAGKPYLETNKSKQSHYFIKLQDKSKLDITITELGNYTWYHNNTTGPRSISKQELNSVINTILENGK